MSFFKLCPSPIPSPPSILPLSPLLSSPSFMHLCLHSPCPLSVSVPVCVCGYRTLFERTGHLSVAAHPRKTHVPSPAASNHLSWGWDFTSIPGRLLSGLILIGPIRAVTATASSQARPPWPVWQALFVFYSACFLYLFLLGFVLGEGVI